jgi:hypothetical protein
VKLIIENIFKNDEMLDKIFNELYTLGYDNIKETFGLFIFSLFKLYKVSTDITIADKIKFILKDTSMSDENFAAVCILNPAIIPKQKQAEILQPPPSNIKKPNPTVGKKVIVAPTKITFEPYFTEKTCILPTFSDKMKILAINKNFERMLRFNIFECISKLYKIENDHVTQFDEFYEKFADDLMNKFATDYKKDKIEFNIDAPVDNTQVNP